MLKVLMLRGIKMTDAPGHPRPLRPDIKVTIMDYGSQVDSVNDLLILDYG